jgi:PAS domain S-box-containing protein
MTRVLIVDDKEENLYYLQALLTGSGFEVITAHHGAEALVKARQAPPAAVISDLLMPVMDGYTLLRHWKADPVLRKAPFLVYTATYTERADEELALNLGADAFVLKPAEPEALLARLREVLAATATTAPAQPRGLAGDDRALLKIYSQTLIRKLEEKTLQLEASNRALEQDIAERKLVETSLRASEASMAAAQRIAHFGSWEMELTDETAANASRLTWSDEMYRIAGFEPGAVEVSNALFFQLVPEEDHPAIREAMAEAIRGRSQYSVQHRLVRQDGVERIIHETAQLFCDEESGRPLKMIGTAHDITEQRHAEDALRKSEHEQRQLARQLELERSRLMAAQTVASMGSWETDLATLEVIWSEQTHRIFETNPATHVPTHQGFLALVHPDDRAAVDAAFARSFELHEVSEIEHRIVTLDGRVKFVIERWQIVHDENGRATRAIGTTQDITERKKAKEELQRAHNLLEAVVSGVPDAVFVKDLQGRYLLCNQATATLVGKKAEDILGKDDTYLFDAEDAQVVMENDREVIRNGETCTDEEVLTAAGVTRTYLATKAPYRDAQGEIIGTIGISRDITERKQGEQRVEVLSELGHRLNTAASPAEAGEIIAEVADALFGWDAATLDLHSHDNGLMTAILAMDTVEGRRVCCTSECDQQPPSALARQVLEKGARLVLRDDPAQPVPELNRIGDKSRPSASLMFVPISEGSRNIGVLSIQSYRPNAYTPADLKMLQLLADYCGGALNRIQTESLRRVSEERLREMAENIGDIFYSYHPASNRLLYANQAYERLWGRPLEAVYSNPLSYLDDIHPEDRPAVEEALRQQIAGLRTEVEFRVIQSKGSIRWVRELAVPIFNKDGKVERIVGTMRDVTERNQAEETMREQARLLDKAQDAIVVRDLDHHILYWNKSAERLYGWTAQEALGRSIVELLYQDPTPFLTATSMLLEKGEWVGEIQQFNRDGKTLTIEGRWTLVRDDKGRPKSILAINTDITERKNLQQQFLRAQRMESIGTLAGGIAHDLNNVLAPILMSIELLRLQEKDPRRQDILSTIEGSAKRGADMVRQVLSFARGVEGRQVEVQVGHLLREIEKIADETFLKTIRVRRDVPDDLWTVKGDPTQLHQVLLNLCVNARDAMPQGGSLTISACNLMLDEQYAAMHIDAKPGPHVVINVEDTGTGMPPEVIERIFEPFFTTKEPGKGTGLGLSTTLAIAKSHGGFVQVQSEPGQGTQFRVFLPALTSSGGSEPSAVKNELPHGNGELILVIDDEASVRQITRQTLEIFGYRVLLAADGTEAAGTYATHKDEIAAVLTDMMMPVMDGQATIQVLRRMNPKVRIIAASGLNTSGMTARATHAGVNHFIAKPYTAEVLLTTLHQTLHGPG